jgi:hypothetical protein
VSREAETYGTGITEVVRDVPYAGSQPVADAELCEPLDWHLPANGTPRESSAPDRASDGPLARVRFAPAGRRGSQARLQFAGL